MSCTEQQWFPPPPRSGHQRPSLTHEPALWHYFSHVWLSYAAHSHPRASDTVHQILLNYTFRELLVFTIRKVAKNYGHALAETITFMSISWSRLLNESGYSNRN